MSDSHHDAHKCAATEAKAAGFSIDDLWNLDLAIARLLAEAWDHPHAPAEALDGTTPADVAAAGMQFEISATKTPAPLAAGIDALVDLVAATGSDVLVRMATLMDLHACYTCSSPIDTDLDSHRAQIRTAAHDFQAIGRALATGARLTSDQRATYRIHAMWLKERLPCLWD